MEVIASYDRNAEAYDAWYREKPHASLFESEARAIAAFDLEGFGVEVGVGTGVFSARLGVPLGLDPTVRMIQRTKRKGIDVIRAVGEFLPLKSSCLDYVLFVFTLCFLTNPRASMTESLRVLKPGGNVVLGFVSRDSEWGQLYAKKKREGHRFYKHAVFYTVQEVEETLEEVGFTIRKRLDASKRGSVASATPKPVNDVCQRGFVCVEATSI